MQKFVRDKKRFKFGTKIALFGYSWAVILKIYCHIWNQHPLSCQNAWIHARQKTLQIWDKKCLVRVFLGPNFQKLSS